MSTTKVACPHGDPEAGVRPLEPWLCRVWFALGPRRLGSSQDTPDQKDLDSYRAMHLACSKTGVLEMLAQTLTPITGLRPGTLSVCTSRVHLQLG